MAKNDNIQDLLKDVADAIRSKKGSEELINPQEFSTEIANLPSGGGQWAVDFGEEIGSNNPYTLGALQEDIDYYNQIQEERRLYAEGKGGRSDNAILNDPEFKEKIAWWPKGMKAPTYLGDFFSLKEFVDDGYIPQYYTGTFGKAGKLVRVKMNMSGVKRAYALFANCVSLEKVDADLSSVENAEQAFSNCYNIGRGFFNIDMPNAINIASMLQNSGIRKAVITSKILTKASYLFANCVNLREVYIDISNSPDITSMFNICWALEKPYVKGWTTGNLGINNYSKVSPDSIHYIISNAIYADSVKTLGLNNTAKENWEASEYYTEDVAKAQELNITIA